MSDRRLSPSQITITQTIRDQTEREYTEHEESAHGGYVRLRKIAKLKKGLEKNAQLKAASKFS